MVQEVEVRQNSRNEHCFSSAGFKLFSILLDEVWTSLGNDLDLTVGKWALECITTEQIFFSFLITQHLQPEYSNPTKKCRVQVPQSDSKWSKTRASNQLKSNYLPLANWGKLCFAYLHQSTSIQMPYLMFNNSIPRHIQEKFTERYFEVSFSFASTLFSVLFGFLLLHD